MLSLIILVVKQERSLPSSSKLLTFRWQCCTTAPVATATSPSRTLLMILAPRSTPLSFCRNAKLLSYRHGLVRTRGTNGNRKCHLDVGQNIPVRPTPAQSLHM